MICSANINGKYKITLTNGSKPKGKVAKEVIAVAQKSEIRFEIISTNHWAGHFDLIKKASDSGLFLAEGVYEYDVDLLPIIQTS